MLGLAKETKKKISNYIVNHSMHEDDVVFIPASFVWDILKKTDVFLPEFEIFHFLMKWLDNKPEK
eukprot:Awhi_evm2s6324